MLEKAADLGFSHDGAGGCPERGRQATIGRSNQIGPPDIRRAWPLTFTYKKDDMQTSPVQINTTLSIIKKKIHPN